MDSTDEASALKIKIQAPEKLKDNIKIAKDEMKITKDKMKIMKKMARIQKDKMKITKDKMLIMKYKRKILEALKKKRIMSRTLSIGRMKLSSKMITWQEEMSMDILRLTSTLLYPVSLSSG